MKQTKCKICRTTYTKWSITQKTCQNPVCAIELMQQEKARKARKSHLEAKVKARTRAEWLRLAQGAFNAFIRERDGNLCISCGRHHQGQIHAGHYLSVGARPELRFELDNVHSQCSACNNYLSGNIVLYRINLIKKIGLERVEYLEGPHDLKKYTIPELQIIIAKYKLKLKEIQ